MQTIQDYITLAQRTAKPLSFADKIRHAKLGLVSEAGEFASAIKAHFCYGKPLDTNNLIEELGDAMWFWVEGMVGAMAGEAAQCLKLDTLLTAIDDEADSDGFTLESVCLHLNYVTGEYGTSDGEEQDISSLIFDIAVACKVLGVSLLEVCIINITKLEKRYQEKKYSDAAALKRTDKEDCKV